MPHSSALVVLAEFGSEGHLVDLGGPLLRPSERRRLGLAMLRDLIERAHLCAGFDPIVAYFPPARRGEVEESAAPHPVWAEPLGGPTPGARAEGFLRHLLSERAYRDAVAVLPSFPHTPRDLILRAARAVREPPFFAFGRGPLGEVGLLALRQEVPRGLGKALDGPAPEEALKALVVGAGAPARVFDLPSPLGSEDVLARTHFDLRADLASGTLSGDDVPLRTMELFDGLGLAAALRADGSVELRRVGPPRRNGA
ncbi:MAG TPA: hypothetical protein VJ547_05230 [Candidatus Thermoplasmatota archaeon]|nr:hypothetical protein [Candidatus Thermoplasmatota archaeon]